MYWKVIPGAPVWALGADRSPLSNTLVPDVTVWVVPPLLVQATVVPVDTVIALGVYEKSTIETYVAPAGGGGGGGAGGGAGGGFAVPVVG